MTLQDADLINDQAGRVGGIAAMLSILASADTLDGDDVREACWLLFNVAGGIRDALWGVTADRVFVRAD